MVINFGLLTLWFLGFIFGRGFIYRMHGKWFKLPQEKFDAIIYSLMGFYKLLIFFFNVVPYVVLIIAK
jgi:hypothetical protein